MPIRDRKDGTPSSALVAKSPKWRPTRLGYQTTKHRWRRDVRSCACVRPQIFDSVQILFERVDVVTNSGICAANRRYCDPQSTRGFTLDRSNRELSKKKPDEQPGPQHPRHRQLALARIKKAHGPFPQRR